MILQYCWTASCSWNLAWNVQSELWCFPAFPICPLSRLKCECWFGYEMWIVPPGLGIATTHNRNTYSPSSIKGWNRLILADWFINQPIYVCWTGSFGDKKHTYVIIFPEIYRLRQWYLNIIHILSSKQTHKEIEIKSIIIIIYHPWTIMCK